MAAENPYINYTFTGIKPFTKTLEETGVTYVVFESASPERVFAAYPAMFTGDDSIVIGKCTSNELAVYFVEFGFKISPSYRSFIVFIYNHHPTDDEVLTTAGGLEAIVEKHLEAVNISDIIVQN